MNVRPFSLFIAFLLAFMSVKAERSSLPLYLDPKASPEQRTEDLLSRMTLTEKIAQMRHIHHRHYNNGGIVDTVKLNQYTGGLSFGCIEAFPYSAAQYVKAVYDVQKYMKERTRLGIPVFPVMEGLHGVVQNGSTIYPQAISQAATFNPSLVGRMAEEVALEMKAIGAKQVLSPDLDIAQEPRWGRVEETYGEDVYLVSEMGLTYVKAIQKHGLICTPKHFVAHGTPTGGLNLSSVKGGRRDLFSLYVIPFQRVIKEAAPLSIMNCYSSYDGEVVAGSRYMLNTLLRDSLGFKGYVYSDWGSVGMLNHFHRVAEKGGPTAKKAIEAGLDLEASSNEYQFAEQMVNEGKIDIKYIDDAVRNILYAKFASGLFEDPLPDTVGFRKAIHTSKSVELAKIIADESTVLLENKRDILPLSMADLKSIAVIGPNADQVQFGDYTWSDSNEDGITPLQGIRSLAGGVMAVNYAKGCDPFSQDRSGFAEALKTAEASDIAIVFVGSQSALLARKSMPSTTGEGYDLSSLKLPGVQEELVLEIAKTGKPVIVVLVTGKPFELGKIKENTDAILVQWYAGEQAGASIADILFGNVNPSGKLPVSFAKSAGHLPAYYNYYPTDKGYYNKKGSIDNPGRDYVFSDPYALYSFGYGLSYTKFEYSNLRLSHESIMPSDTLTVTVDVRNKGDRNGKEVVQLYVRDVISSVMTPIKQLQGFKKIELQSGQTKTVSISLPIDRLALYDRNMRRVVEPGDFQIMIGSSSENIHLKAIINVPGTESVVREDIIKTNAHENTLGKKITVTGTVRDIQANVMSGVKVTSSSDGKTSVKTDLNGNFTIKTRINDTLAFEYPGHTSVYITVNSNRIDDVTLIP